MSDSMKKDIPGGKFLAGGAAEADTERLIGHEYDGIEEYDNPLPRWWVQVFWLSFVFSIFYVIYYHGGGPGLSHFDEYAVEMQAFHEWKAEAAMAGGVVDEATLQTLMADASLVSKGHDTFVAKCAACHGDNGEGRIGPNLTDGFWISGGSLMDIYKTVDEGVLAKGMPAWGRAMSPDELKSVVAYIGSIRGKELPGKAPEGEKYDQAAQ